MLSQHQVSELQPDEIPSEVLLRVPVKTEGYVLFLHSIKTNLGQVKEIRKNILQPESENRTRFRTVLLPKECVLTGSQ